MKTGILLINTGTPDAPTVEAIRPYLTEFLMDPAIIGAPKFIRKPLVKHIVSKRPERTVAHYRSFWTPEGSPFMLTSLAQRDLVSERLNSETEGQEAADGSAEQRYQVELAMRYGNPSIRSGLERLRGGACDRVVIVPLFPQNVNVCAGTCIREARSQLALLAKGGWRPDVREVPSFCDQPAYREALARQVRRHWTYTPGAKLVVSFHSTMMADIDKDDTYLVQDTQTKERLAQDLGVAPEDAILSFQSRFDSRKWLQPFTENVLLELLAQGVEDICVVCPGFVADNIETMIEVNQDLRRTVEGKRANLESVGSKAPGHVSQNRVEVIGEVAHEAKFTYVPALGTDPGLIEAIASAIKECDK